MTLWHTFSQSKLFEELRSSDTGLSALEAHRRFGEQGANVLPEKEPPPPSAIFIEQFKSPLIYLLLGAGALMYLIGEKVDSMIVFAVLLFNALVGTIQEGRAAHTLRSLKRFVETNATVVREGVELIVPDRELVAGDLIVLEEGERVPADARIITAYNLKVDEAALTGESVPVHKVGEPITHEEAPVAEQRNMVFKGTYVRAGSGRAVVVATGLRTVMGGIARAILSVDTEMPLKANLRYLSRVIMVVVAGISVLLLTIGLLQGNTLITMFGIVVSLAVSIIPEGLPIVMTLVLATGVWRMGKRNVLVKKLHAIEALGQARVIAVDKTGTITKNELVIRRVWMPGRLYEIAGDGYEPSGSVLYEGVVVDAANHDDLLAVGKAAALVASARVSYVEAENRWRVAGDPTEAALIVFGQKLGFHKDDLLHELPLLSEMPFDYTLLYHATVHHAHEGNLLTIGGAPEAVLAHCVSYRRDDESHPLTPVVCDEIEAAVAALSHQGLRVIALASRVHHQSSIKTEAVQSLVFLGLVGMKDALRSEVAGAMVGAQAAGIKVVMITGDHKLTALAIAREAGIARSGDTLMTGADIDAMSDEQLAVALQGVSVFARVTPEHKLRIIQAYKKRGEIIAMTGDGVNDAPSLVAADLGVAMGKVGTEVAKEAADIVLLDDNFGSIVSAVEEGRNIYITIRKVILYLFSTSLGEAMTITGALLLGYPLPLVAAQIIWLNFVTDGFLDVALAMEPKDPDLLRGTFERPKKYMVDSLMATRMVLMALPMVIGTLYIFDISFAENLAYGSTMALTTLAVFQWFNAWNCRSNRASFFSNLLGNRYLIGATAVVIALQFLAIYNPFLQGVLHTVPLSLADWLTIIPIAASIVLVEEVRKLFVRRRLPTK